MSIIPLASVENLIQKTYHCFKSHNFAVGFVIPLIYRILWKYLKSGRNLILKTSTYLFVGGTNVKKQIHRFLAHLFKITTEAAILFHGNQSSTEQINLFSACPGLYRRKEEK